MGLQCLQGGDTMVQGIMAAWIFILITATIYADENVRHAIPEVFGVILVFAVVAIPIWLPKVLSNYQKREETKEKVAEIEVVK
jgi:hypothetical protein